jgi:hypothetical protein
MTADSPAFALAMSCERDGTTMLVFSVSSLPQLSQYSLSFILAPFHIAATETHHGRIALLLSITNTRSRRNVSRETWNVDASAIAQRLLAVVALQFGSLVCFDCEYFHIAPL